ncbi:hypothetical protein Pla52n_07670 [Stieleria varia]|uniref:General secretion pathway GspH domain-containing protein n=2 Tax=Stieleria varia TaxID=2528005 RepID=A0A5C6B7F6_9BACT|nr:hypothetical protein Pla52n_07670 [Stieleria varia]
MSLLEVTIGSMMVAVITVTASSVAVDMTRHIAGSIRQTRVVAEARLAIESLRRDFGGASLDDSQGDRVLGQLVGRRIASADELQLCFDGDGDAHPDWLGPDRVITYSLVDDQLIRTDSTTATSFVVAQHVESVNFEPMAGEIEIQIDFALGDFSDTYLFVTADVP